MIAIVDPRQAEAVVVGEGHAPLWQYLLACAKKNQTSPSAHPWAGGSPRRLPLRIRHF
jgi:hypothetical protein